VQQRFGTIGLATDRGTHECSRTTCNPVVELLRSMLVELIENIEMTSTCCQHQHLACGTEVAQQASHSGRIAIPHSCF